MHVNLHGATSRRRRRIRLRPFPGRFREGQMLFSHTYTYLLAIIITPLTEMLCVGMNPCMCTKARRHQALLANPAVNVSDVFTRQLISPIILLGGY